MIERTFGLCAKIEVPAELDYLLQRLDKRYSSGKLHDKITGSCLWAFGGYSTRQKTVAGRVIDRAGYWADGFFVDHVNNDPGDNQRHNLRMVSASESTRNRRLKKEHVFEPPVSDILGVRTYSFSIRLLLDDDNADLLEAFTEKYRSGKLDYRVKMGLTNVGGGTSIPLNVLKYYGVSVPKGMVIDHIDDNHGNNLFENLQVITPSENNKKRVERQKRLAATV